MRVFKVGGIRFLRVGRYQFSFCRCRVRTPSVSTIWIAGTVYTV